MKRALIFGITGQDGSYLAELLLTKKYEVFGISKGAITENLSSIQEKITLIQADISNTAEIRTLLLEIKPDEVYNLAAPSFLGDSSANPIETTQTIVQGTTNVLSVLRKHLPKTKYFQTTSSEMYGTEKVTLELESLSPKNIYSFAKLLSQKLAIECREQDNLFISNGIMFNHESPRRKTCFVTRKITDGVARIKLGLEKEISLGSLEAKRDWGFAGDYVEAMWLALQQDKPRDYLIATGELHSVREFLQEAFVAAEIDDWQKYVKQDKKFLRVADRSAIVCDPSKTFTELNWKPKVDFKALVHMMVKEDIRRLSNRS